MRTTLSIDDDVLATAKAYAKVEQKSVGEIVSRALRSAFVPKPRKSGRVNENGILLLPPSGRKMPLTLEMINMLRDEEE